MASILDNDRVAATPAVPLIQQEVKVRNWSVSVFTADSMALYTVKVYLA